MAIFRKIHVTFWSDSFTSTLKNDEKLFYLYLITNERTSQCGIYEITKRQMSFDLGYSIDTVSKLIKSFEKHGKIKYNDTTSEIAIKNWNKYNYNPSGKVKVLTDKELTNVKDRALIQYLYSIDTVSIHNPQEEEEQEEEIENKQTCFSFDDFWDLYSKKVDKEKCIKAFNKISEQDRKLIKEKLPLYLVGIKDKQYQKNPLTYLNGKCWNDEIQSETKQPTKPAFVKTVTDNLFETYIPK